MTNDGAVSLVERLALFFTCFDVFLVEIENLQPFPGQTFNHVCQTFQIFQNYPENGTLQCLKYFLLNFEFDQSAFTCAKAYLWVESISVFMFSS